LTAFEFIFWTLMAFAALYPVIETMFDQFPGTKTNSQ